MIVFSPGKEKSSNAFMKVAKFYKKETKIRLEISGGSSIWKNFIINTRPTKYCRFQMILSCAQKYKSKVSVFKDYGFRYHLCLNPKVWDLNADLIGSN